MDGKRQPKIFYGYIVVIAGFLILMSMYGTLYSFGVFFKSVLKEFGWTRAMTSGAYSLCFLLSGAVAIATGRLNDRFGPRIVMSCAGLLLGLGYFLMSKISTIWELYLYFGVIVGMGMSGGITPSLSTVARWFVKRRGLMTGITIAGVGTGTLVMPLMANRLISIYSWRTSFTIIGIIIFLLIVGLSQFLIRDPGRKGLSPYGSETVVAERPNLDLTGLSLREAIRTAQLWILFVLYVCAGFFVQVIIVHIVIHATELGISPVSAASVLSIVGVGSLVGRVIGGGVSDRFGNKPTITAALILMGTGFIWLLVARDLWMLYIFATIFGLAYGEILCMMSLLPAELFGLRSQGAILGIIMFASTIGGGMGPVVAGRIFDITGSYWIAFVICIALSVAGLIMVIFIKPVPRRAILQQ
ncbi:MAG: MFS transporter [Deltaproteobacteria bacterium]|nr:MFS transporter [Deltaproteobacteria bacterium]